MALSCLTNSISMKNFNSTITLLALFFLSFYQLRAQEIENHRGKFFIGLNGGAAWQQSDLTPQLGLGWGLYLGSNLLYGPNSPLSLDWRLRYLGTATYGQDTKFSTGANIKLPITNYDSSSLFMNHRTHFHDLSLEARINFEQLRRKSNIHLALYGGAGIGFYNVATDQLDNTGADYRSLYNSIDVNSSSAQIFNQIITGRDQVYETWLNNDASYKAFFTPNVGAELGIWIKSFLLGIGHRVNWTFKDDFDAVSRGSNNNIHHYTHLFLHFRIDGNRRENTVRNIDPVNPVTLKPEVEITNPGTDPATVTFTPTRIRAIIRNVEVLSGVSMTLNGINVSNFNFIPAEDVLEANVSLNPGSNIIRII